MTRTDTIWSVHKQAIQHSNSRRLPKDKSIKSVYAFYNLLFYEEFYYLSACFYHIWYKNLNLTCTRLVSFKNSTFPVLFINFLNVVLTQETGFFMKVILSWQVFKKKIPFDLLTMWESTVLKMSVIKWYMVIMAVKTHSLWMSKELK